MCHQRARVAIAILAAACITGIATADEVDQSCTMFSGVRQIYSQMPIGQTFVPSVAENVGVDLRLNDINAGMPADPLTVRIREGTIDGPVVFGSTVTLVPGAPTGFPGVWESFRFDAPLILVVGETYVVEAVTTTQKWGWVDNNTDCYEAGGHYIEGVLSTADSGFRTWAASPYMLSAGLECEPASGELPLVTKITTSLGHGDYNNIRRIAARIDLSIAGGPFFGNWRAGFTDTDALDPHVVKWLQQIPALETLVGDNVFTLRAEDVTPAPYNQPPYLPSGATATDSCTVTAYAP